MGNIITYTSSDEPFQMDLHSLGSNLRNAFDPGTNIFLQCANITISVSLTHHKGKF